MNRSKLIQILCGFYIDNAAQSGRDISLFNPSSIPLLAEMTDRQRAQLESGSGNPIAEMHQINSSAGMSFNYYKLFEEANGVAVDFEWRDSIPLLKSTFPANIDVKYEMDGTIFFVECKFLEPYYSWCERNKTAYFTEERYPIKEHVSDWIDLMRNEDEFKYYNVAQIFRHMLAIYRHVNENPGIYADKKVVLKSVIWKMPDKVLDRYNELVKGRNAKANALQIERLMAEKAKAEEIINVFARKINWDNFSFKSECYNDILGDIKGAKEYDNFIKQYMLD